MTMDLIEVLSEIAASITQNLSPEEVERNLNKNKKIGKNIIAAAYSWVYEKISRNLRSDLDSNSKDSKSLRFLSEDEVSAIGLKNYNFLLHFYNIGLLTNEEFSLIIEQIKIFDEYEISEDKLKMLILSRFLIAENNKTLPGSRLMLYSSDTIN